MEKKTNSNTKNFLLIIKSKIILKKIGKCAQEKIILYICRFNKEVQKKFDKNIDDFKNFFKITLEIIPKDMSDSKFINIEKYEESSYHFFINNDKNEINLSHIKNMKNIKKNYCNNRFRYRLFKWIIFTH